MDVIHFMEENKVLMICACVGLAVILLFIYRVDGFVSLLKQAIGTVLQQLCSLVLEAVCLVFKIINSLEIYIVLLIDALTGKASSNGKIASLAIGVLSIASFYTTYSGMQFFMEQKSIAFLITLGIQAILLSTSLRINDVLNLDTAIKNLFSHQRLVKGAGILCVGGCAVAYSLPILNLPYSFNRGFYHIIYMLVIIASMIIVLSMIIELIKTGISNRNVGTFLFVIYFAVLSVSSFFSYNAFVPIMHPESIRSVDTFQVYRLGVIDLMERVDEAVDNNYYESIHVAIELELQELEKAVSDLDESSFLSEKELWIYNKRSDFEKYIENENALADLEEKRTKEESDWQKVQEELFENSGGVGQNTKEIWERLYDAHESRLGSIDAEILKLTNEINYTEEAIVQNIEEYKKIFAEMDTQKEDYDCSEEFDLVNKLLLQDEWTIDEENNYKQAVLKLENARQNLSKDRNGDILSNNLEDMIEVYRGYIEYRNQYSDIENQILGITVEQGLYEDAYNQMQSYIYELLRCLPETSYTFYDLENVVIQTTSLPKSDYYSTVEGLKRNASPSLSQIEKNMRTFINNKMVGVTCALMALLIDMMILFVGIILPKDIHFHNNSAGKYSEQEISRILSNLFNKPIKR